MFELLYRHILLDIAPQHYVTPPLDLKIGPVPVDVTLQGEDQRKVALAFPLLLELHQRLQVLLIRHEQRRVILSRLHDAGRPSATRRVTAF